MPDSSREAWEVKGSTAPGSTQLIKNEDQLIPESRYLTRRPHRLGAFDLSACFYKDACADLLQSVSSESFQGRPSCVPLSTGFALLQKSFACSLGTDSWYP